MLAIASSTFNPKEGIPRFITLRLHVQLQQQAKQDAERQKTKQWANPARELLWLPIHARPTNRVHIHTGASAGAGQGGFVTEKGGGRRLARRPNHRRSVRPTAASAYCDARHQVNDCIHRCVSAITSVCWGRVWSLPGGRRKKPTTGLLGYSLTRPVSQSSFETHKPTTHPFHTSPMHSLRPTYKCFRQGSSLP